MSNLWDANKVESGCIPALTNKNTHIYCPFHCTGTLSSTYIMYIFRNNLFGFFPKEIPNPNKSKYFWNDYLWNQIIPNFLKVSIEQIQIIPNTPLTPQIHPNTNFLMVIWYTKCHALGTNKRILHYYSSFGIDCKKRLN